MSTPTAQEELFLACLFDDDKKMRHPDTAKQMAGYPKDYPVLKLMRGLNKQIIESCDNYLLLAAPDAVRELISLLFESETPGSKLKLQILIEILDRAGVVKKEKSEVAQVSQHFMFVVPPKVEIKDE